MKLAFNKAKIESTREHSLKVFHDLIYIDSLDDKERASMLKRWVENYLQNKNFKFSDLNMDELLQFQELFYKNISFLKQYRAYLKQELEKNEKLKKFLKH
jgi:hypothetical protein